MFVNGYGVGKDADDPKRYRTARQELLISAGDELVCMEIFEHDKWKSIREDIFTVCKLELCDHGGYNHVCKAVATPLHGRLLLLAKCRHGLLSLHRRIAALFFGGRCLVLHNSTTRGSALAGVRQLRTRDNELLLVDPWIFVLYALGSGCTIVFRSF